MYIYCSNNATQSYVRFGKRFKHGKSINYLAMSPRIKDAYSYKLAELQYGYITEEEFNAWCEDALDSFVWEPNTSCFECDSDTELPIVVNISQAKTLIGFIKRLEDGLPCDAFLVQGDKVGVGTDKEPLVDVISEQPIEYDISDLIDVVIDSMAQGFRYTQETDNSTDDFVYLYGQTFQYKNMLFIQPKSSYIEDFEYTGPVMDKFKYEDEVEMQYDDIMCAFIDAEYHGGREVLAEDISEWGDSIYDNPAYFEDAYHIAISVSKFEDDIYVCGQPDDVEDFLAQFPIDYKEIDVPIKLKKRFMSMKFYE